MIKSLGLMNNLCVGTVLDDDYFELLRVSSERYEDSEDVERSRKVVVKCGTYCIFCF